MRRELVSQISTDLPCTRRFVCKAGLASMMGLLAACQSTTPDNPGNTLTFPSYTGDFTRTSFGSAQFTYSGEYKIGDLGTYKTIVRSSDLDVIASTSDQVTRYINLCPLENIPLKLRLYLLSIDPANFVILGASGLKSEHRSRSAIYLPFVKGQGSSQSLEFVIENYRLKTVRINAPQPNKPSDITNPTLADQIWNLTPDQFTIDINAFSKK
jgi:hypothetical protein